MNEFLKSRSQIEDSTKWLQENGYVTHPISCKDFELKQITERLTDGDLLDMGADGSFILHNAIRKDVKGKKVGIDLAEVTGDNRAEGAEYFKGDLMATPFEDESFDTIVSQSTIEHEVDLSKFAKECARLLRVGGKLIVSFDYWPQRVDTKGLMLYGLKWNILNQADVLHLVEVCEFAGLSRENSMNWEVQDAVINDKYCSPFSGISYTFGIIEFIKR
jgi:SAM-dependent methyltransferase